MGLGPGAVAVLCNRKHRGEANEFVVPCRNTIPTFFFTVGWIIMKLLYCHVSYTIGLSTQRQY